MRDEVALSWEGGKIPARDQRLLVLRGAQAGGVRLGSASLRRESRAGRDSFSSSLAWQEHSDFLFQSLPKTFISSAWNDLIPHFKLPPPLCVWVQPVGTRKMKAKGCSRQASSLPGVCKENKHCLVWVCSPPCRSSCKKIPACRRLEFGEFRKGEPAKGEKGAGCVVGTADR